MRNNHSSKSNLAGERCTKDGYTDAVKMCNIRCIEYQEKGFYSIHEIDGELYLLKIINRVGLSQPRYFQKQEDIKLPNQNVRRIYATYYA